MKQRIPPRAPLAAFQSYGTKPVIPMPPAEEPTSTPAIPDAAQTDLPRHRMIQTIEVHLIDPNPLAPRDVYTTQMILERAEDLRSQGQHDPIHVIPHPDRPGRYIIADGWTRVQACVEHKVFDELLAEIHNELTLQESAWFGYTQNEGRQQHCDLDRAMFYEKLIIEGASAAEIARRAKLSKASMSYFRAYAQLPKDILEIIRQQPEKFGSLVGYNLAKLCKKEDGLRKAVSLAGKFAAEDQPVRWLINQVQAALSPNTAKISIPLRHIRYANGYFKQSQNEFGLSISVTPEQRDAFAQALEKLLETVAIKTQATEHQESEGQ